MIKYFTGIGSRDIPNVYYKIIVEISEILTNKGYILRSGKADGSDKAFQEGFENVFKDNKKTPYAEIYIPWKKFELNTHVSNFFDIPLESLDNISKAKEIAKGIHPAWQRLSQGAEKLHTRNIYQVLGKELNTPSNLLIAYAEPKGKSVSGGTRTAWELAKKNNIPCLNIYGKDSIEIFEELNKIIGA